VNSPPPRSRESWGNDVKLKEGVRQGVEAPDGSTETLAQFRFDSRKGQKNNLLHISDYGSVNQDFSLPLRPSELLFSWSETSEIVRIPAARV